MNAGGFVEFKSLRSVRYCMIYVLRDIFSDSGWPYSLISNHWCCFHKNEMMNYKQKKWDNQDISDYMIMIWWWNQKDLKDLVMKSECLTFPIDYYI